MRWAQTKPKLKYDIKKKQIEIGDHLRLRGDPSVGHYSNDIPGSRGVAGNRRLFVPFGSPLDRPPVRVRVSDVNEGNLIVKIVGSDDVEFAVNASVAISG